MVILGCIILGAILGLIGGVIKGEREGGDYNFAPLFYAPFGALVGMFLGAVFGVIVTGNW